MTRQTNPKANPAPWLPPGQDGGESAARLGSASYDFSAIPSSIEDYAKIVELLHIMEYWAAPFGTEEFRFMYSGIQGSNGINYLCGPSETNYFYANQPGQAVAM